MIVSTPNQSFRSPKGGLVVFHYECEDEGGSDGPSGLDHFAFRVVGSYRPARLNAQDQWEEKPFSFQAVASFSNRHPVGLGAIHTMITTKAVLDQRVRELVSDLDGKLQDWE